MPRDKTSTYNKIIPAARKEFATKGFEQASLRNIAADAGMSAAGLYRHFKDKEALFDALVQPLLDALDTCYTIQMEHAYSYLESKNFDEMWTGKTDLKVFIDLIYEYFNEFRLLLCCSDGTKHASFVHDFVKLQELETLKYMAEARNRGISVKDIKPQELHLLLSAYYSAIFEIIVHKFKREDAEHYLETLQEFFYPGWRNILGL